MGCSVVDYCVVELEEFNKLYILLHPCILGNRGGLKVINPSDKPLFMYFLINIYKITCIQYTCIHQSNIITHSIHHSSFNKKSAKVHITTGVVFFRG